MSHPEFTWIFPEFASQTASAFETVTGERPGITLQDADAAPAEGLQLRRHTFSRVRGAMWTAASEADALAAGRSILDAAGLADAQPEKLIAEFFELVSQAIAGTAQAISRVARQEVRPEQTANVSEPPAGVEWKALEIASAGGVKLLVGVDPTLASVLAAQDRPIEPSPKLPAFDVLLDVELPIRVSFGRAQVPLKDVLKLTTGSIIELNRAISDPVEVIVNNCVIARGEVVSVEGNFGVRIREVISRQERLRTLQ